MYRCLEVYKNEERILSGHLQVYPFVSFGNNWNGSNPTLVPCLNVIKGGPTNLTSYQTIINVFEISSDKESNFTLQIFIQKSHDDVLLDENRIVAMPTENQFIKVIVLEKVVTRNRTMVHGEGRVYPSYFPQSLKETRYNEEVCTLLSKCMAYGADNLSSFYHNWTTNGIQMDKDRNSTSQCSAGRKGN